MKNNMNKTQKIIFVTAGILCAGILIFAIFNSKDVIPNNGSNDKYNDFAKCVTDKGAILYTSNGCPHCLAQKNLLGAAIQYIKEIECTSNPKMCVDAGISGVPTWIIGDKKIEGFDKDLTMKELSDITGCELPL